MATPQTLEGLIEGQYRGVKRLKISSGVSEFPREILDLYDTLEHLDLSGSQLSRLPKDFYRLHKLKVAFFSDCKFTTFPSELSKCRSLEMIAFKGNEMTTIPEGSFPRKLRWLILTNNKITELPESIGQCYRLQKCMLAGNQLIDVPQELSQCRKLGLLRLSCNNLTSIPAFLFDLPELAFLSFAGNPCVPPPSDILTTLPSIPWSSLTVQELLGEGASGVISKGVLANDPTTQKDVAIKLFKGSTTSDGSPSDEMAACLAAGTHPRLISTIGTIISHPEQKHGLVLRLVPADYTNLGLPPTLESCTRDAYPPTTTLPLSRCLTYLRDVAGAAGYLHLRGIAHGDLYAHNILVDGQSTALLGDLGAATVYGAGLFEEAERMERLEVLAFGHLLEDLLGLVERCVVEKELGILEALVRLHWRCTGPVVGERPVFDEVYRELSKWYLRSVVW